ncbi:hypothetical protein FQR65_LT09005 [Abscondita terminalis]|nr:hypothetical protein FQR65_LT09005 [Abscondita terminalis]
MYSNTALTYIFFISQLCTMSTQNSFKRDMEQNVEVPCENDDQCRELNFENCLNNTCRCANKNNCVKANSVIYTTRIGTYCSLSSQCYIENSYCSNGKCECLNQTIASNDGRRCLKINTELNSACEQSSQCVNVNAECIDGQCLCPQNMHSVEGMCYNSAGIESPCQKDEECALTEFSHCVDMECQCNTEYVYSKTYSKCLLKAGNISSKCLENSQCTSMLGFGSECFRGYCFCKDLYNYKRSINKCVRDTLLGNQCGNHSDCHQIGHGENRLECLLGVCKCKLPYSEISEYCVRNSGWTWTSVTLPDLLPFLLTYAFFCVIR